MVKQCHKLINHPFGNGLTHTRNGSKRTIPAVSTNGVPPIRVPHKGILDHRAGGEAAHGHFRRQLTSAAHNDPAVLGTTNYLETGTDFGIKKAKKDPFV
jgi:hypothetical protein